MPSVEVRFACTACDRETLRPLLDEVQALSVASREGSPRRRTTGFSSRRLSMLLAADRAFDVDGVVPHEVERVSDVVELIRGGRGP